MSDPPRIVLMAADGAVTRIVYHALAAAFGRPIVLLEPRVPVSVFLRRRVQRLGVTTVAGQVLFTLFQRAVLAPAARTRVDEIKRESRLVDAPIPEPVHRVESVNSAAAREALRDLDPAVVVVNGTRIIAPETLAATRAPVLNMHAGVTPLYRGVHGGYWALRDGRPDLVGTTIHLIDPGIDTGSVLHYATFQITERDSFATYPYLHVAAGLPLLLTAVEEALRGELRPHPNPLGLPSRLRTHPTLWDYLWAAVRRRVR